MIEIPNHLAMSLFKRGKPVYWYYQAAKVWERESSLLQLEVTCESEVLINGTEREHLTALERLFYYTKKSERKGKIREPKDTK
jgi:hypothetical protein